MDGNKMDYNSMETEHEKKTESELLEEIVKEGKKRTLYNRITAVSSLVLTAAFIIALILLVPKAYVTLSEAERTLSMAEAAVEEVRTAASGLPEMISNITLASENANEFITGNSASVTGAVQQIGSIDYVTLNKAINDLKDAVEPFAKFMNRFK